MNMIKASIADEFCLDVVVDDYGYSDYCDYYGFDSTFNTIQSRIIGLTSCMLIHDGQQLWFDGFVVEDKAMDIVIPNRPIDVLAGAPFMEQNDVSIRPSKHRIMFGDSCVFQYDTFLNHCSIHTRPSGRDCNTQPRVDTHEYVHETDIPYNDVDSQNIVHECNVEYADVVHDTEHKIIIAHTSYTHVDGHDSTCISTYDDMETECMENVMGAESECDNAYEMRNVGEYEMIKLCTQHAVASCTHNITITKPTGLYMERDSDTKNGVDISKPEQVSCTHNDTISKPTGLCMDINSNTHNYVYVDNEHEEILCAHKDTITKPPGLYMDRDSNTQHYVDINPEQVSCEHNNTIAIPTSLYMDRNSDSQNYVYVKIEQESCTRNDTVTKPTGLYMDRDSNTHNYVDIKPDQVSCTHAHNETITKSTGLYMDRDNSTQNYVDIKPEQLSCIHNDMIAQPTGLYMDRDSNTQTYAVIKHAPRKVTGSSSSNGAVVTVEIDIRPASSVTCSDIDACDRLLIEELVTGHMEDPSNCDGGDPDGFHVKDSPGQDVDSTPIHEISKPPDEMHFKEPPGDTSHTTPAAPCSDSPPSIASAHTEQPSDGHSRGTLPAGSRLSVLDLTLTGEVSFPHVTADTEHGRCWPCPYGPIFNPESLPWTGSLCPQSSKREEGPLSHPRHGTGHVLTWMMAAAYPMCISTIPTCSAAGQAPMDVSLPHTLQFPHPSAPPDSIGLSAVSHSPPIPP